MIYAILWILFGIAWWCYGMWKQGYILLDDLKNLFILMIIGPIASLIFAWAILNEHRYKVLWKRDND